MKGFLAPIALAIAALFLQQAWWVRGFTGAIVGAALFIAIPAMLQWAKEQTDQPVTVRIECMVDFLPTRLPTEGRILIAQLMASQEMPPHQTGQSMIKYGDPGEITAIPQNSHAYRCEINTVGRQKPTFDVAVSMRVEFREIVRSSDKSAGAGELFRSGDLIMHASKIDDSTPFRFWVSNESQYFATITDIKVSAKEKKPVLVVSHNLYPLGLGFSPKNLSLK